MNVLDWSIVFVYSVGMIAMSVYLGRKQASERDYYLGGNKISYWGIGISTMATQCSTNSLLGTPAFIIAVGGLLWLQYEIAVPLAMIGIMIFLVPFFRKQSVISVYEYLEKRFGVGTRTLLSIVFQFSRAFATGVTVYGISLVLERVMHIPFWTAVLLLGVVTVTYDFFGGMRAVIYSDVIQMIILYGGIVLAVFYVTNLVGGFAEVWKTFPADKISAVDFKGHGFGDGKTFAFWPMLVGGLFLYMSYYGCDQTQVQRELSSKNVDDTNMALFINGMLRFPLVATLSFLGVALGAFIIKNPAFLELLKTPGKSGIEYNLAVPVFVINYMPHGVIGLVIIALFAAAMSSLDSTINSLSAASMSDIIERFFIKTKTDAKKQLLWSRITTVFWGGVCTVFAFFVGDISSSIAESINKIGSLVNGPILATFLLAILTRRANGRGTVTGIIAGFLVNLYLWIYQPQVSWLWWNVTGCVATFSVGYLTSLAFAVPDYEKIKELVFHRNASAFFNYKRNWPVYYGILLVYFCLLIAVCYCVQFIPGLFS